MTHPLRMFLISPDLGRILTTEVFSLGADQLRDHGGFRVSITVSHIPAEQTAETLAPRSMRGDAAKS